MVCPPMAIGSGFRSAAVREEGGFEDSTLENPEELATNLVASPNEELALS